MTNNIELDTPTNLLEDWAIDYAIFSLKYPTFTNRFAMWQRFIRS